MASQPTANDPRPDPTPPSHASSPEPSASPTDGTGDESKLAPPPPSDAANAGDSVKDPNPDMNTAAEAIDVLNVPAPTSEAVAASAASAAQLTAAEEQVAEFKDGYIRARAEVENIRRRSQNEIIAARKYAVEGFARELLTVVDSLQQAAQVELDDDSGAVTRQMREGLELTRKQLAAVLEKFGVSEVAADNGGVFDPEIHQAVSKMPSDTVESDHIVTVMQTGFMLKDRLLRPAMVVVAE